MKLRARLGEESPLLAVSCPSNSAIFTYLNDRFGWNQTFDSCWSGSLLQTVCYTLPIVRFTPQSCRWDKLGL